MGILSKFLFYKEEIEDMQFGIVFPNFGKYSDVRVLAELAREAEQAGWDGVFLNDTIQMQGFEGLPANDPWMAMTAMALSTKRVKLGPWVTAPTRRRPWKMAREATTLDHLSGGRLILGIGSGDEHDRGFELFGEEMDSKKRGRLLDESLAIFEGLWSGKPFSFDGEFYHIKEVTLLPASLQQPRIPIWIGWLWPRKKPLARAARFDGATPFAVNPDGSYRTIMPDEVRQMKQLLEERRVASTPFDIVINLPLFQMHDEKGQELLRAYAAEGTTWGLQYVMEPDPEVTRATLRQGPPVPKEH